MRFPSVTTHSLRRFRPPSQVHSLGFGCRASTIRSSLRDEVSQVLFLLIGFLYGLHYRGLFPVCQEKLYRFKRLFSRTLVLASGGGSAPEMPFRLILLQDQPHLLIQQPVDLPEAIGHILMHCALGNAEAFRGSPDGGLVIYDIRRLCPGPLLDAVRMNSYHSPRPPPQRRVSPGKLYENSSEIMRQADRRKTENGQPDADRFPR